MTGATSPDPPQDEAQELNHRAALRPVEVDVRHQPELVPHGQAGRGALPTLTVDTSDGHRPGLDDTGAFAAEGSR